MNINTQSSLLSNNAVLPQDAYSNAHLDVKNDAPQSFMFANPSVTMTNTALSPNTAFTDLLSNTLQNLKLFMAQFNGSADLNKGLDDQSSYADILADSFEFSNMSTALEDKEKGTKVPRITTRKVDGETIESFSSSPKLGLDKQVRNADGRLVDDDLSGHFLEGKNNESERFRVAKGQPKRDSGLDPRAEAVFNEQVKSDGSRDYVFTAQYNVISAKDTTIFQILNTDKSKEVTTGNRQPGESVVDRHHPVLFLEAETRTVNGKRMVEVVDRESGKVIYDGPSKFRLKVETDGTQATITAHPEGKAHEAEVTKDIQFDRDSDTPGRQRGDVNAIRYGAYHHDNDRGKGDPSNTTANIVVTKARLESVKE